MAGEAAISKPAVLFVTRKWAPAIGGMETYAAELTAELGRSLSVDVFALPGQPDGSPPSGLSLVLFACRFWFSYWRRASVPDVLHVCDMASWPLAMVSRLRPGRPLVVLSAHGTDVSYHRRSGIKGRLYGIYLRVGARLLRSAQVIANSSATAEAAGETGWRSAAVIPLATRPTEAVPASTEHGGHVLFAGRLVERKGCRWFVDNVLPVLPPEITLHVAGTMWDEAESAVLDNPRVAFLGALHGHDLTLAFRSALCVVVPNIEPPSGEFEGFGLIAAEAAASGGVVVAADCGGLKEAVIDGETGFLVPVGEAEAWRQRITDVSAWSPAERDGHTTRAAASARARFNWTRVAAEVLATYRKGLKERSRAN